MCNNSKYQFLLKNIGILTISNFASKIMIFVMVPLYTNVLSTVEYGVYDLVVSTVQLLFPLLTLNITDAVMRFSMDATKSLKSIVVIGFRYIVWSFISVGLLLFLCSKLKSEGEVNKFAIYIFLYFIFYVLNQFLIQLAKGLEHVIDMGIAGVLSTIILLCGNISFLLCFKAGLIGFFMANILSQAIPSIFLFVRLKIWKYIVCLKVDKNLQKEMLTYSVPLIFSVLGWWVNNASDKYVVTFLCGAAANGILSVAYKIPSILNTLQSIFIQAWQISAIKEYGSNETKKFYGRAFTYLNILISLAAGTLILLSRPIASILYAKEFYVAWHYVPFLLISSVINSASGFLGPILSAIKDSGSMAKSAIYGAVVNTILNVVFVYFVGIQGATIATCLASYVIYAIRMKAVNDKIEIKNSWKINVTWFLLCFQAFCEINMIGYIIELFIFIILIFINFSDINEFLKKIEFVLINKKEGK